MDFAEVLKEKPVIAAIRNIGDVLAKGLHNINSGVLFVLGGTIFDLPALVEMAGRAGKEIFVDIDLIKGVGRDASGIRYLARESRIHGVITTKSNLIKSAKKEGLISVQRIFLLDSDSLTGGINVINKSRPDSVEVLPGLILPKIMDMIRSRTSVPIIAGGLITKDEEIAEILSAGAIGISTSSPHLYMQPG